MSIHYTLVPSHPEAHLFTVSVKVDAPDPAGQRLTLPTWIPGSYMIRDFARNIVRIDATSQDQSIELTKLDKTTWITRPDLPDLTVTCEIYAWDLSVRAAHLDSTHGFFNGTSVFLCVEGQAEEPCSLRLPKPAAAQLAGWQVATSLPSINVDGQGFGEYLAENYDELIDHPVEMGTFERARFMACGAEHELVLTGKYTTDVDRICRDLTTVCEHHIRFFGEPAPVDRYVFLVMVVGDGYGGLEHRASTSLLIRREHLPVPGDDSVSDQYLEFLGLCSHEYFHTWNVKRIKPARFVPYDLAGESHTTLLWAFEGITSYYDDLALVHCGLIDQSRYLKLLAWTVTRVLRGSGCRKQSVADSSFDAWTKFYKQDENAPNAIVSYYAKGALVAFCLDCLIREKTGGQKTLQNLMQVLWKNYLDTGEGLAENEIEILASELCGEDISSFFRSAVYGTEDLPLEQSFQSVGVEFALRPAESQNDKGGAPAAATDELTVERQTPERLSMGLRTSSTSGGLKITHVFDDGPAQKAGLSAGDTLIAIDSLAVTSTGALGDTLARYQSGDQLTAHVFRRDELMKFNISLQAALEDTCVLTIEDDQSKTNDWLSVSNDSDT